MVMLLFRGDCGWHGLRARVHVQIARRGLRTPSAPGCGVGVGVGVGARGAGYVPVLLSPPRPASCPWTHSMYRSEVLA